MGVIRRAVERIFFGVLRLTTPRRRFHGLPVHSLASASRRAVYFERVGRAVDLIAKHDPAGLRRLLACMPAVVIWPLAGAAGALNSSTRVCLLDPDCVLGDNAGVGVATVLVHEGMHARLRKHGFGYAEPVRGRIESICKRAELHFLERISGLSDRERLLELARRAVEDALDADYGDASKADALAARLRQLEWPEWAVRAFTRPHRAPPT